MRKKVLISYLSLLCVSLSATSCDLLDFFNGLNTSQDSNNETASSLNDTFDSSFNFGEDSNGGIHNPKTGDISNHSQPGSTNNPSNPNNPSQPEPRVSDIENIYFANPNIEVVVGTPTKLGLVIYPSNATDKNISYSISDKSFGSVSSDGILTATKEGVFTISAETSRGITATCSITAKKPKPQEIKVTNIYFKESSIQVTTNIPTLLEVVIEPNDATNKTVNYSISDPEYGSVTSAGVLTATKSGNFTVTASSVNGFTTTCSVTALDPKPEEIEVTNVSFKNSNIEVMTNTPTPLEVSVEPFDATDKSLNYFISDSSFGSISSDGILTATKSGNFTITARAKNGISATCNVTALDPKPQEVEVTNIYFKKPNIQVIIGAPTVLEVVVEPSNATDKELEFSISDSQYGSITSNGTLTATKKGDFTVTARAKNGVSANCNVSSGAGPVTSISADPIDLIIGEENIKPISYTVSPADATQNIRYYLPPSPYVAYFTTDKSSIKGYQAGHTQLYFWDDVNNNKARDLDEYFTSVDVNVHDISELTNTIEASCISDGKKVFSCKCGCNRTRVETIPATSHDIEEIITKKATCTTAGSKTLKCKTTGCKYEVHETIPAFGGNHEPKIKDPSLDFLASRGNILQASEYYYKCSRCGEKTDTTYTYGNHTDLTNLSRLTSYLGSEAEAKNYKLKLKTVIDAYKEYDQKSFDGSFKVYNKDLVFTNGSEVFNIQRTAATSYGGGFPYVHWNRKSVALSKYGGKIKGFYEESADGYNSLDKRKQDFPTYFGAINDEIDPLIRSEATDAEKALIISLYTSKYFQYDSEKCFFFSGIKNKNGNCSVYGQMVCYLANRFNLPCIYLGSGGHGWNNISIDGTWYTFDVTNSDCNMDVLFRERNPIDSASTNDNNLYNLVKSNTSSKKYSLIQLYKNGEFAGIYTSLDSTLKQVNDKTADYKIVLGIGYDGVKGLSMSSTNDSYYLGSYETNIESIACKSLRFERCQTKKTTIPSVSLPSALRTANTISVSYVSVKSK